MEPIKVSIDVTLDFSENAKSFLASILMQNNCACNPLSTEVPSEQPVVECEAPAATEEPAVKPSEQSTAKPETPTKPSVTIEDVRKVLQAKVNDHRAAIKEKLSALGAPSVTKLDESKYQEMYDFLESL